MVKQESPIQKENQKEKEKEIFVELTQNEYFAIVGALQNQKTLLLDILKDPEISLDDKEVGESFLNMTVDAMTAMADNLAYQYTAGKIFEMRKGVVDELIPE